MRAALFTPLRLSFSVRTFLIGCVFSGLAAIGVRAWGEMTTMREIEDQATTLETKITARVAAYLALLRGAAGYFSNGSWIALEQFRRYFRQVEVVENYPGVQGLGLSVRLSPAELPGFVRFARTNGWPDFHVWPEGVRPEYHTILYLEPENVRNRAAIGYDMHTEATRRDAMDRARDTGRPAVTAHVNLVQEIETPKQAGFLVYVPFYHGGERPNTVEARRALLAGYAYAAFRAGDFVGALVGPAEQRPASVSLYDGTVTPGSLVYRRSTLDGVEPSQLAVYQRAFPLVDRRCVLEYASVVHNVIPPYLVAVIGFIASAGIAFLVRGTETARSRAERSEAATREREGRLAVLVDAVPAVVSYVDRDLVVRFCNRRFADWLGIEPRALAGRPLSDLLPPDEYAGVTPHLRRALAGETVSFERWARSGTSAARYLGTIYVPHRDDAGSVLGLYTLTSDLTAHKRAEEAAHFVADCGKLLIASMDVEATSRGVVHLAVPRVADVAVFFRVEGEELQAAAVAHIDALAELRLGRFLDVVRMKVSAPHNIGLAARTGSVVLSPELNEGELERAGQDEEQRRMLRSLDLRSALHVPVVVRNRVWAVYSFGTTSHSARKFSDEHRQLAEEVSTRVRLAVENALLFREAQQEIEERRRAERVARDTEERFRLLVEGVQDYAIMTLDDAGRIESWNAGAERILGYDETEAIGQAVTAFYLPADVEAGVAGRQIADAREHGAASDERWFIRKDGTRFWGSSHTVALREDNAIRGYAWIMRDLTDRKRMEDELERRVEARTADLNEAVQELEAFSYSVSHDLRAPLRTIRGFTELTLEEAGAKLTEDERNYLDRVRRASLRLERLIGDLLAYTRVSKTKVELQPIALHALVSDIQREHPEFQPPRADVRIEGTLLPVIGNEAYLTQCLTNLLGNAVKFVAPGVTPNVRVWTERRNGSVRLTVQDNGIGIPAERLSRAFEIFERLHTSGSYEGTGVGLAIVRRAVQRMKGTVGVSSVVGEGTTFWIELPAAESDGTVTAPASLSS